MIGRTMVSAIHEALPQIKTMYLCDLDVAKAEEIAQEYSEKLGVEIIPTSDSKGSALKSQLIVGETTARTPIIDKSWLTPGCGLVTMHSGEVCEEVFLSADGVARRLLDAAEKARQPAGQADAGGQARRGEHHRPERAGARREEAAYL